MTANQIAYARLLEERRSHVAQETETHRANVAKESENKRANNLNYASTVYGIDVNAETQRRGQDLNYQSQLRSQDLNYEANILALEQQAIWRSREINEQIRHNQATEQLEQTKIHVQAGAQILGGVISSVTKLATAASLG